MNSARHRVTLTEGIGVVGTQMQAVLTATTNPYLQDLLPVRGVVKVHEIGLDGHISAASFRVLEDDGRLSCPVQIREPEFTYTHRNASADSSAVSTSGVICVEDLEDLIYRYINHPERPGWAVGMVNMQDLADVIAAFFASRGVPMGWKDGSQFGPPDHSKYDQRQ